MSVLFSTDSFYFFFGAAFLAVLGFAVAFLGLGAFGFFGVFAFFTFDGDFFGLAATAFFFSPVFLGRLAAAFLAGFFSLDTERFVLVEEAPSGLSFSDEALSLKDPDAPFPFVCTNDPDATALLRYFLMNGASFSASTL